MIPAKHGHQDPHSGTEALHGALLAAFKDPQFSSGVRARLQHSDRAALIDFEQALKAYQQLTPEQRALVERIRPGDTYITVAEGQKILRQLDEDLERENRREAVTEMRAAAVSNGDVELLRGAALDWDALIAQPPQVSLINGVLTEGAMAVLVGAQGIGKSFVSVDWCLSVATGTPWLGRDVQQRRVLYVVGEGGDGLGNRVSAWAERSGTKPDAEHFRVLPAGGLDDPRRMRVLAQLAAEEGAGLVVLDTLSSLAPEAEKPNEAPRFLAEVKRLREGMEGRGTVLLVHHSGVADPARARNSSALEANPDEVLVLTSGGGTAMTATLTGKKIKDGPAGWTIPLRMVPVGPSLVVEAMGVGTAKAASNPGAVSVADHPVLADVVSWADRVTNVLAAAGTKGASGPELALALGLERHQRSALYKALGSLRAGGQVVFLGAGRGARNYLPEHKPAGVS